MSYTALDDGSYGGYDRASFNSRAVAELFNSVSLKAFGIEFGPDDVRRHCALFHAFGQTASHHCLALALPFGNVIEAKMLGNQLLRAVACRDPVAAGGDDAITRLLDILGRLEKDRAAIFGAGEMAVLPQQAAPKKDAGAPVRDYSATIAQASWVPARNGTTGSAPATAIVAATSLVRRSSVSVPALTAKP
jgi:hypothetical protein